MQQKIVVCASYVYIICVDSKLFPWVYLEDRSASFGWADLVLSTIAPKLHCELLLGSTY
jgi:hypothetical protein